MTIHKQYNLTFRWIPIEDQEDMVTCDVNQSGAAPPLQGELCAFIRRSGTKGTGGLVGHIIEEINKILNGTWDGYEDEGDNYFVTEMNDSIKLGLTDGFAYIGPEHYSGTDLPKMPLTDLKAIFEEWIAFKASVYGV